MSFLRVDQGELQTRSTGQQLDCKIKLSKAVEESNQAWFFLPTKSLASDELWVYFLYEGVCGVGEDGEQYSLVVERGGSGYETRSNGNSSVSCMYRDTVATVYAKHLFID